jgi:putative transposase
MVKRGIEVDHLLINHWAIRFLSVLEKVFRKQKRPVGGSLRMDETYIKVDQRRLEISLSCRRQAGSDG